MRAGLLVSLSLVLSACGGSTPSEEGALVEVDTGTGESGAADTISGEDSAEIDSAIDSGAFDSSPVVDSGGDTGGSAGDTEPAPTPLRFVAMGDTGKGNEAQGKVGKAIAAKCAKDGCDFVQLLGDNIYDSGVSSVTDPQWTTKFETPYGDVMLPFYAVLGNHDYGGNGTGNEFGKGQNEVDYTKVSTKWKMPAKHYTRSEKGVDMFGLDTNMMMFGMAGDQRTAVKAWIAASKSKWKIAFGHHPYHSNGEHGDAGKYEGIPLVPIVSGQGVKDGLEDAVCGKVDLYVCGHDHNRQWLKEKCKGTELIVSGGGSSTTDLKGKHDAWFQEASSGFVYIVIDGDKATIEFVDDAGAVEYTRSISK